MHQPGRHLQELAGHLQVGFLPALDGLQILLQQLRDGNIVDINFVFLHQMQQKIQRPLENRKPVRYGFHRCHASPNSIRMPRKMKFATKEIGVLSTPVKIRNITRIIR